MVVEDAKIVKLRVLIHEAAVEADAPRIGSHEYPQTPAMYTLLDTLRYTNAIFVLDEMVNNDR